MAKTRIKNEEILTKDEKKAARIAKKEAKKEAKKMLNKNLNEEVVEFQEEINNHASVEENTNTNNEEKNVNNMNDVEFEKELNTIIEEITGGQKKIKQKIEIDRDSLESLFEKQDEKIKKAAKKAAKKAVEKQMKISSVPAINTDQDKNDPVATGVSLGLTIVTVAGIGYAGYKLYKKFKGDNEGLLELM